MSELQTEEHEYALDRLGPLVDDVPVEEVKVVGRGPPLLPQDLEEVVVLSVDVADNVDGGLLWQPVNETKLHFHANVNSDLSKNIPQRWSKMTFLTSTHTG